MNGTDADKHGGRKSPDPTETQKDSGRAGPARRILSHRMMALAGILLALVAIEMALRVFPPRSIARLSNLHPLLRHDDLLGYVLPPNLKQQALSEDGVTEYLIETNEYGLRDGPYRDKDGRRNILGLGSSFLFGDGVPGEDCIMAQLQRMLESDHPGQFRTINAGMLGYSLNQDVLYYLGRGRRLFEPDIVVLFYTCNDATIFVSDPPRDFEGVPIPDFKDIYKHNSPEKPRWETPEIVRFLRNAIRRNTRTPAAPLAKSVVPPPALAIFNLEFLAPRHGVALSDGHCRIFEILRDKTRAAGAQLLVVYLPSSMEVMDGKTRQDVHRRYAFAPSSWDWDLGSRRICDMLTQEGIRSINLVPLFRRHWETTRESLFIRGEGHFTSAGCRVAAQAVHEELRRMLSGAPPAVKDDTDLLQSRARAPVLKLPMEWGTANQSTRWMVAGTRSEAYGFDFTGRFDDSVKGLRFFIHPRSAPVRVSMSQQGRPLGSFTASASPDSMWNTVTLVQSDLPKSARAALRMDVQSGVPGGSVRFTPPQTIRYASPASPPVVIISLDGVTASRLPMYGGERDISPCLRDLSRDGVVFEDVTAPSASCLSAHVSLLTGLDAVSHGIESDSDILVPEFPTLAAILSDAGYTTAAFTAGEPVSHRNLPGFQSYSESKTPDIRDDLEYHRASVYNWIRNRGDETFFLFFQTQAADDDAGFLRADQMIGGIVSELKQAGRYDDALIIVTSDNGAGGRGTRIFPMTPETFRIPLIIKFPFGGAKPASGRAPGPAGLIDVMPTVLNVTNRPMPMVQDGQMLTAPGDAAVTSFLTDRIFLFGGAHRSGEPGMTRGMRLGRYKLLVDGEPTMDTPAASMLRIYDIQSDPAERSDMTGEFFRPGRTEGMELWTTFRQVFQYRVRRLHQMRLKMGM